MNSHLLLIGLGLACCLLTGCFSRHPHLPTVDHVELAKIEGDWFVTHHIPYWLERDKLAPIDSYTLRDDGTIGVEYRFRPKSLEAEEKTWEGYAWVVDPVSNAHWKIRFVWPFKTDFMIIDRDPDYAWMVVGHPSRDLLWILSRTVPLTAETEASIKVKAAELGFDPSQITAIKHLPPAGEPGS